MTLLVAVAPAHAVNYQLLKTYPDPNPHVGSRFGESVAVNGSRVVILDATFPTFQTGTAYVFDRDTGNPLPPLSHDGLGGSNVSVRASGPYFVIGAPFAGGGLSGRVYVYEAATGTRVATLAGDAGTQFGRNAVTVGNVAVASVSNYNDPMAILDAVDFWDIRPGSPTFQQRLRRAPNPNTSLYFLMGFTLGVSGTKVIAGESSCGTCPNGRGAFVLEADLGSPSFGTIVGPVIDRGTTTDALNDSVVVDATDGGIGFLRIQVSAGESHSVEAIDLNTQLSAGQVASSAQAQCTTGGGFFGNTMTAIPVPGFGPLLAASCIANKSAVVFRGHPSLPPPAGTFPQTLPNPNAFTEPGIGPALAAWDRFVMVGNAIFRDLDAGDCGDGTVDGTEQCDDGNRANGDCCSSTCTIEPAGSVCRAAAGPCDVAETCPGTGLACPANRGAVRGTPCGSQDTSACDAADTCDGLGACLTNPTAASTACANDGNACTDDVCDGAGACQHVANAAACDDGDVCTSLDTCRAGTCTGGTALPCDDGDPCTTDRCDPAAGCTHPPGQDGAPCDDGQPCTTDERCFAGSCAGGTFSCGRIDTKPEVRGNNPVLKVTCQTAGSGSGPAAGSCEATGFVEPDAEPAATDRSVPAAMAGVTGVARVEALDPSDTLMVLEPAALGAAPAGPQVTRSVRRRFNRRGRTSLKLRLNPVGTQLLRESGRLRVRLVVVVTDRSGQATRLNLLVNLLRRRR